MEAVEAKIRAYIAPLLISGFSIVMWSLVSEIRSDVKTLLATTVETQVKVAQLEKRMQNAEEILYSQKLFAIKPEEYE